MASKYEINTTTNKERPLHLPPTGHQQQRLCYCQSNFCSAKGTKYKIFPFEELLDTHS